MSDALARVWVQEQPADKGGPGRQRVPEDGGEQGVACQDGGPTVLVPADLGRPPAGLRAFADEATDALGGRVDVLVNNAGNPPRDASGATLTLCDEASRTVLYLVSDDARMVQGITMYVDGGMSASRPS